MAGMENENYNTGGMGAAIFGDRGNATSNLAMGDEYVAPQGLPDWKRPSFDEDDRAEPGAFPDAGPRSKLQVVKDELKIAKAFYFCFFGAFGSLFPLMAVYFKALGMDAAQATGASAAQLFTWCARGRTQRPISPSDGCPERVTRAREKKSGANSSVRCALDDPTRDTART